MLNQTLESDTTAVDVGRPAPLFSLPSIQGSQITLEQYQGRQNVLLWFSRGFTCNFCRSHMRDMAEGYDDLQAAGIELIQIAPNLAQTAESYFAERMPAHPFVCDPDKRLYAVYNLGDHGALEATRNTLVSFSTAVRTGEAVETIRASWIDVVNRNFIRRLHHHAFTAIEQGVFIIDQQGFVRYRLHLGTLDPLPPVPEFVVLTEALCP
jgi:peroxiredoxin